MRISEAELAKDLAKFGQTNIAAVTHVCRGTVFPPAFILATGSRESNLQNEEGDHGHAKGFLQINDVTWGHQLLAHAGVKVGTWGPFMKGHSADDPGYVPGVVASLGIAMTVMSENYGGISAHFQAHPPKRKVTDRDLLWITAAAYNRGAGRAITGFVAHGDPDVATAGGDYGKDVLERMDATEKWLAKQR